VHFDVEFVVMRFWFGVCHFDCERVMGEEWGVCKGLVGKSDGCGARARSDGYREGCVRYENVLIVCERVLRVCGVGFRGGSVEGQRKGCE
jgi:hypothetical protein